MMRYIYVIILVVIFVLGGIKLEQYNSPDTLGWIIFVAIFVILLVLGLKQIKQDKPSK